MRVEGGDTEEGAGQRHRGVHMTSSDILSYHGSQDSQLQLYSSHLTIRALGSLIGDGNAS